MIEETLLRLVKPVLRAAVMDVCTSGDGGRPLSHEKAEALFGEVWTRHRAVSRGLPREPTLGGRLNVRLASLTLECVRALQAMGYESEEAVAMTASIAWSVYRKGASIPRAWGRLVGRSPASRMDHMVRAFLRFPFSEPSYRWEVQRRMGTVHLDVRRCPVADFFVGEDAGEICARTWCTLDYPLAEYWGGRYERDGTLAEGDAVCRMRWITG